MPVAGPLRLLMRSRAWLAVLKARRPWPLSPRALRLLISGRRERADTFAFRSFLGSSGQALLLLNPSLSFTVFAPTDLRQALQQRCTCCACCVHKAVE